MSPYVCVVLSRKWPCRFDVFQATEKRFRCQQLLVRN